MSVYDHDIGSTDDCMGVKKLELSHYFTRAKTSTPVKDVDAQGRQCEVFESDMEGSFSSEYPNAKISLKFLFYCIRNAKDAAVAAEKPKKAGIFSGGLMSSMKGAADSATGKKPLWTPL